MSTDNEPARRRTIRMSDYLWETLAELAAHEGRTIGEEIRLACEERLVAAGYDFDETRPRRKNEGAFRKVEVAS